MICCQHSQTDISVSNRFSESSGDPRDAAVSEKSLKHAMSAADGRPGGNLGALRRRRLFYDVEDETTDALAESGEVAEVGRDSIVVNRGRIAPVRAVE
jgi:hypothetical protein